MPNVLEDTTSTVSMVQRLQDVTKSSTSTIVAKESEAAEVTEAGFQISNDEDKDQLLLKWEAEMGTKYTIVVIRKGYLATLHFRAL